MIELILRFVLGGAIVSLFALAGSSFRPRTFAGLFGAAPSVALATLSIVYRAKGANEVAIQSRSMLVGCLALLAYGVLCVSLAKRRPVPMWFGTSLAWLVWFGVALALLETLRAVGAVA